MKARRKRYMALVINISVKFTQFYVYSMVKSLPKGTITTERIESVESAIGFPLQGPLVHPVR